MPTISAAIKIGSALVATSAAPGIITLKVPANATYADITLDGSASTPGTGQPAITVHDWLVNGDPCYEPSGEEVTGQTVTIRLPITYAGVTSYLVSLGVGDGPNITGDFPASLTVAIERV